MNCLSWNCCGLGKPHAILELTELVKKYSLSILFLMETKAKDNHLKRLCSKMHMENVFIEPRVNTGGGLALYWKDGLNLKVIVRNGNGSGSGRVFSYLDLTIRGLDLAHLLNRFFSWGPDPPCRAPTQNHKPKNLYKPRITNRRI